MKRKIAITFETEEVVFYKTRKIQTVYCELCGKTVELQTTESAADSLGLSEAQVFSLLEMGLVHFFEAEKVLVCRNSLEVCAEMFKAK